MSEQAMDVYLSQMDAALLEIGRPAFDAAIERLIKTSRFMPTIEAIRDACGLNEEKRASFDANQLWQIVLKYADRYFGKPPDFKGRDGKGNLIFEHPRRLPDHIDQAVRAAGGIRGIIATRIEDLHFRKTEFVACLENYRHTPEGRRLLAKPYLALESEILRGELKSAGEVPTHNAQLLPADDESEETSDDDLIANLKARIGDALSAVPEIVDPLPQRPRIHPNIENAMPLTEAQVEALKKRAFERAAEIAGQRETQCLH